MSDRCFEWWNLNSTEGCGTMPRLGIAPPAEKWRRSTRVGRAAMVGLVTLLLAGPASAQQQRVDPTWLSFNTAAKTVRFQLIAGLTGLNGDQLYRKCTCM